MTKSKRKAAVKSKEKLKELSKADKQMAKIIEDDSDHDNAQFDMEIDQQSAEYDNNDSNYDMEVDEQSGSDEQGSDAENYSDESGSDDDDVTFDANDEDEFLQSQAVAETMSLDTEKDADLDKLHEIMIGLEQMSLNDAPKEEQHNENTEAFKFDVEKCNDTLCQLIEKLANPQSNSLKSQLNKLQSAFEKLKNAVPDSKSQDFPHFVYMLTWLPKKKPKFVKFLRMIPYIGIGYWCRSYDHVILTQLYKELLAFIEKLDCSDLKHNELLKIFDSEHELCIIRVKCKSREMSACLEFGLIEAFELSNLIGNKISGSFTSAPIGFLPQDIINASCYVLYQMYLSFADNFPTIKKSDEVFKSGEIFFERIILDQLVDRFNFPLYGDSGWTKKLLEKAEESVSFKKSLGQVYDILAASSFVFRKNADGEAKSGYYRERALRNYENVSPSVFGTLKHWTKMTEDEKALVRKEVKRLAKARSRELKLTNPERWEKKRKAKALVYKRYQQSKKGKLVKARYETSEKGKTKNARYRQSAKGKSVKARYKQSDKGKESDARYRQSKKGKETATEAQKRYETSEKGKKKQQRYKKSDKGKLSQFKSAGYLDRPVNVEKTAKKGKRKCNGCSKVFLKNVVRIKFFASYLHPSCLVEFYDFKFNTQEFEDWTGTKLLTQSEINSIQKKITEHKSK